MSRRHIGRGHHQTNGGVGDRFSRQATKLTRVLQLMVDHRMKSLPVLDAQQQLAGVIAREDIMRALTDCARG